MLRPSLDPLPASRIREVANAAMGRDDVLKFWFGEGDLPLGRMLSILHEMGYTGYLSLEWEKKWHPEIEEPEIALPQYARALALMLGDLGVSKESEG